MTTETKWLSIFQTSEIYSLNTNRNNPEGQLPQQTRCTTLELFFFTDHKWALSSFLVMHYFLKNIHFLSYNFYFHFPPFFF